MNITSPLTPFGEVAVAQRQNIIELKSNNNIVSALRDVTTLAGSATVTAANSEYVVATTALANDSATLDSAEKGRYQAGYSAEAGIGVRYAGTPTGQMKADWGYFGATDGFYFGKDSTSVYIAVLRASVETKVRQSAWNVDKLDGTGSSGLILDLAKGNIFQIVYSWYGYGGVEYTVLMNDTNGKQRKILVHTLSGSNATNIVDPNQPIRARVQNGSTATAHTLYVGGRQYSILGQYNPNVRNAGQYRLLQTSITSAAFVPLITIRRKSAFETTSVKLRHFTLISDQNIIVQVRLNGALTGASYITPSDHTAQETAVEVDISATAITGGVVIDDDIMSGGTAANRSGDAKTFGTVSFDFVGLQPVTLCAKAVSTTATVTSHLAVIEEW